MTAQVCAGKLFQGDAIPICLGSEQPQPQMLLSETPFFEQAQLMAGPLQEHSLAHPQSWQPESAWIAAAAQSSPPCTLTINANEIAISRTRKITAFILRTQ